RRNCAARKQGLEGGEFLRRRVGSWMFIARNGGLFPSGDLYGYDLFREKSAFQCAGGTHLGSPCEGILRDAFYGAVACHVFAGFRHGVGSVEVSHAWIDEPPADGSVVDFG